MSRTSRISFPLPFDDAPYLGDPRSVPPPAPTWPAITGEASRGRVSAPLVLGAAALAVATAALAIAVHTALRPEHASPAAPASGRPGVPEERAVAPAVPDDPSEPAEPASPEPVREPVHEPEPERPSTERPSRPRPAAPRAARPAATAATEPAPAEPRSLDALMDDAVADPLPETPSRTQVLAALRGLADEVAACREPGLEGTTVTTRVVFDGATGRTHTVEVDGDLAWTATGACVARTVRHARVDRFARDRFEVAFPYRL